MEEKVQLLAVPRALRTPEQLRRIDELCAESLASRSRNFLVTSTTAASSFWLWCAHRRLRQRHVQGWFFFLAQCSLWLQTGPDARHHGRFGPQDSNVEVHRCRSWTRLSCPLCATAYALVQLLTVEVPQVQLIIKVIYIPVAAQSWFPWL